MGTRSLLGRRVGRVQDVPAGGDGRAYRGQRLCGVLAGRVDDVAFQLAEVGHVYLLQYSYTGPEICSLLCLEQTQRAGGQFDTKPCTVPPYAESD